MKIYQLLIISVFFPITGVAQKAKLTLETYKDWSIINDNKLSNDGAYAFYSLRNEYKNISQGFIVCTKTLEKIKLPDLSEGEFLKNNIFVGLTQNDTLVIVDIQHKVKKKIANVLSFKSLIEKKSTRMIVHLKDDNHSLLIFNLGRKDTIHYNAVLNFLVSKKNKFLLLKRAPSESNRQVDLVNLASDTVSTIFSGNNADDFIFDNLEERIAFIEKSKKGNSIWLYDIKRKQKREILNSTSYLYSTLQAGSTWRFNSLGTKLWFSVYKKINTRFNNHNRQLTIWSYQDPTLADDVMADTNRRGEEICAIDLKNGKILKITNTSESIVSKFSGSQQYIVLESSYGRIQEINWNKNSLKSYYLLNTETGLKKVIKLNSRTPLRNISISPNSSYLIYYDGSIRQLCSYNIINGKTTNIFSNVHNELTRVGASGETDDNLGVVGNSVWVPALCKVIINGSFDLWLVDPAGSTPSSNLTGGIGMSNQIVFHQAYSDQTELPNNEKKLLLTAFDIKTKKFGIINLTLGKKLLFANLKMHSYYISGIDEMYSGINPSDLTKAKSTNDYLIKLEQSNHSQNIYLTEDFERFTLLSNNFPESEFNWLTSELYKFQDVNGLKYEGVLYKPEDFDSLKKYPVILNYYEEKSNELNKFEFPKAGADLNIPHLVSNEYILFKINIPIDNGGVGERALRAAIASADFLNTFPWVDTTKLAIAGHSFGGFETNYIITHTRKFAAAISGAGISELTTFANGTWGNTGITRQNFFAGKIGAYLSDNPIAYMENSPIYFVKNITTPILMMHNLSDNSVPFEQGKSFFMELRRLQKKAWLLSYKDDKHGLSENNAVDYFTRVKEFLDHYLKNLKTPEWMDYNMK